MNKDVIYIEPEDDITDILTGIKNSKAKIVALVPPKKANVLKSAVNFKLLARTSRESEKPVVLVTTDSALLKLAAITSIPVAKNLQSKPELIAGDEKFSPEPEKDDIIDGEEAAALVRDERANREKDSGDELMESVDLDDDEGTTKKKKGAKKKLSVPNFEKYRKFIIMGAIGLVLMVGFVVWALAIAPGAKILVSVRTVSRQFSENVSFTTDAKKEDVENGIFLLETQKLSKKSTVSFEATGQVDKGEKASGTLTFKRNAVTPSAAIEIAVGTKFTVNGLTYVTTEKATLRAITDSDCNGGPLTGCTSLKTEITASAKVAAEAAGAKYNIEATDAGWAPANRGYAISSSELSGGTSKIVKIVTAEDINKAKESLDSASTSEGRAELTENFSAGLVPINSSFKATAGDPVPTPAVGEEVKEDGGKPTISVETTFSMFGVDRVSISEYIEAVTKNKIANEEGQKVYSTGVSENAEEHKAFLESFRESDGEYTARLKSTTKVGPEVTDEMVMERSLNKKIGEVQSLLKSINGVSSVSVETSFFWVTSIPGDVNKVTVEITVE